MASKDIADLCLSWSLEDKDEPIIKLDGRLQEVGSIKLASCLADKLISNKLVNREAFRAIIPKSWRIRYGVEVEVVHENMFVFQFEDVMDRNCVLKGGSWSFNNALLVLEASTGSGALATMLFSYAEFWVQLHNVLLLFITRDIGHFLGSQIGQVVEMDIRSPGDCLRKYLRTCVRIDIRKLLIRVIRFRGWTRVGSPPRSSNRTYPVEAAQPTRKAGTEAPVYPSSSGKREKFIVVNPAVTSLHVFNSPELMQEGKNQPFESNDILSCIDVGGALLVFKGSGTSGLFKPGVVQLDDKIVIVDCGGGQNHVPLQTASESVLGGRKKGWKRRTWTGMVIEEEAPISPQLGKRDSSIVGGADELQ
ncbi:hypothetical protein ACOSQ3_016691 [Xanthoceras sorbifolium]